MKVKDIMTKNVIVVSPETPINKVAEELYKNGFTGVPVVEGNKLVGIITEADLVMQKAKIHFPQYIQILDSFLYLENPGKIELEKAHPDILNVFLQVFEDGRLTDGTGKTINFTNTIIIATSNAGAELIREEIKKGNISNEILKEKLLDFLQSQGIFKPEFLNRFDAVVAFHPLSKEELNKIINLMINDLNKNLSEKEISVELTPEAIEKVINKGYDPVFGARPLRRALQDTVENLVAQKLLEGSLNKGDKLVIRGEDIV